MSPPNGTINAAVEELLKSKKDNNRRVSKNGYLEMLQSLKEMGVNIGVVTLYKKVERVYRKWGHQMLSDFMVGKDVKSKVSHLTPGGLSNENNPKENDNSTEAAKKCCRPKGSTCEKKHKDIENVKDAWHPSQRIMQQSWSL